MPLPFLASEVTLSHRLRLLQAATALLYLGPLLAGLSGQGWATIPVFAAIFVLWSVILRPHLWPASFADLARGEALLAMASLVATQLLLVALCFAFARGLGGVTGLEPRLPFWLPAAISFLSVPLSRLVWDPATVAAAGFDPLLHRPGPVSSLSPADLARALIGELSALPAPLSETELQAHLDAISAHIDALLIRRALTDAPQTATTRQARIVHATDPDVAELLSGSAYPAEAFRVAGSDTGLLQLFATRCARALEDEPALAADCPAPADLIEAARTADTPARDALLRLEGLLRQSQPA